MREGDKHLSGITVKLLDSNNTEVKTTTTNAEGYYIFDNLDKGVYKIKVSIPTKYNVTEKLVGTNIEINSKINSDGITDEITKLNSISSPLIKEEYVNGGLALKEAKLVVEYREEGTEKVLAEGYEENKLYDDSYNAINGDGKVPNNYKEVRVEGSPSGLIDKDIVKVIYYYS